MTSPPCAPLHVYYNPCSFLFIWPSIVKSIINLFQFRIIIIIFLWPSIAIEYVYLFHFKNILFVFMLSTVILFVSNFRYLRPCCRQFCSFHARCFTCSNCTPRSCDLCHLFVLLHWFAAMNWLLLRVHCQ